VVAEAIVRGVKTATSLGGLPTWRESIGRQVNGSTGQKVKNGEQLEAGSEQQTERRVSQYLEAGMMPATNTLYPWT